MPPGKWWKDPQFVKKLNLNESQISKLDEEFVKSRRLLIELKNKVESERFELDNSFEKRDMDENTIKAQYQKVEDAKRALSYERFRFIMEARKIMGYEKFNQLKTMFVQFHRNRMQSKRGDWGHMKPDEGDMGPGIPPER
jgi:Spy/CpxP family protein refolding chaperone